MIFLYVLLAILAIILFLLFVNVHVVFRYDEKAKVTVRVLFFRFDGMKLFRFFTKERKNPVKETAIQPEQAPETESVKPKRKGDLIGFAEFLIRISRIIYKAVREHFSKMKIHLKSLRVSIGSDDAAKTALIYGGAIQAANALVALLQQVSNLRCDWKKLYIGPDFTLEKSEFSIHLDLIVKPIHVILVLLRAYFRLLKGKDESYE